jgi:hypothetical protein
MRRSCPIPVSPPQRFRPLPERLSAPSAPSFHPLTSTKSQKILGGTSECLKGKPYGQAAAIVDKYMKDHPEEWHKPMAGIVLVAIVSTCTK